jgi:hypothetical protein
MQTQAFLRTLPSDSRTSRFPLLRSWLRTFRGRETKFSQTVLPKGGLQRLRVPAGTVLACGRGTLWVTDAHGWEVVLEAGEDRIFAHEEDLLVEALAPSVFTVDAAPARA